MSFFDDLGARSADDSSPGRDRPGGRVAWWTIVGVLVVVGAAYAALVWYAEDTVPLRASVEGVDIGGQSARSASETLRAELEPRLSRSVVLTHGGQRTAVVPEEAGVSIDYAESVREAGAGRTWTPGQLWRHYTGNEDTKAVLEVDQAAMGRVLDAITAQFDELALEGTLDFSTGRAVPVYGKPGLRVDRAATVDAVKDAAFDPGERELPVETRKPYITGPAVQEALVEFGRPAMSAPVTLLIGTERVVVPPRLVARSLTMIPSDGDLEPLLDGERLMQLLQPRMRTVGDKPRNARIRVVDGRLVRVPARIGAAWDDAELEKGLLRALVKPRGERRFRVAAAVTQPRLTDQTVASWGIQQRIQGYRVRLGTLDAATKVALRELDNRRIPAGKTFSYLAAVTPAGVGPQTRVVGASVFTAAFRLGLEVAEHAAPQGRDPRFPEALDITVDAQHDVRLTNTTPYSVLVSATVEGRVLDIGLWSSPYYDVTLRAARSGTTAPPVARDTSADCRPERGSPGFTATVTRRLQSPQGAVSRDRVAARYPAERRVTCGPAPRPTRAPTPAGR